ncbi:MAG: hypothetical protein ACRCX2_21660 [Paraclostridium sp.]
MIQLINFNNIIHDKDIFIMKCVQKNLGKFNKEEIQFILDTVTNSDVGYHLKDGELKICTPHKYLVDHFEGDFERMFTIMKKLPYCTKPIIDKFGDRIELVPMEVEVGNILDIINMSTQTIGQSISTKIIYRDMLEYTLLKQMMGDHFESQSIAYDDLHRTLNTDSEMYTLLLDDANELRDFVKPEYGDKIVDMKVANTTRNLVLLDNLGMGSLMTQII